MPVLVVPLGGRICKQDKRRHLVAKLECKWCHFLAKIWVTESIVRCALGNVSMKVLPCYIFLQPRRGRAVSPPHCLFGPWRKNLLSAFDTVNWQKENRNPPRFPTKNWRELQVKTMLIVSLRKNENCKEWIQSGKIRSKVYAIGWFQTLNFWPIGFFCKLCPASLPAKRSCPRLILADSAGNVPYDSLPYTAPRHKFRLQRRQISWLMTFMQRMVK